MELLGFRKKDVRLVFNLAKMNIRDRYLGSALGIIWAILNPLMILSMYTFIFGFVFKAKLPGAETTFSYAIWLISGLVPYLAVSEALTATANSVVAGASIIKNVVFKSETIPYAAVITAIIPLSVGLLFLLILLCFDSNYPSWHIALLVPVIILQFSFLCGVGLFLAAFAVFVRDIIQALSTIITFLMFLTPIFYSKDMMPVIIQKITFFNPLFQITQPYRDILINHKTPDMLGLIYLAILAIILNVAGLRFFRKLKGFFEMKL